MPNPTVKINREIKKQRNKNCEKKIESYNKIEEDNKTTNKSSKKRRELTLK